VRESEWETAPNKLTLSHTHTHTLSQMTDVSESSDDMSKEAALRKHLDHVSHMGIVSFIYLFIINLGFRVWQTKLPRKS